MLIVSGEILLLISSVLLITAIIVKIPPLLITAPAIFSYYLTHFIVYHIKKNKLLRSGIKIERAISGTSGGNILFTDKRVKIIFSLENLTSYDYNYLEAEDCLPQSWQLVGENQMIFSLPSKGKTIFTYLVIAKASGRQIMPGLYLTLIDESHLFTKAFFYPLRSQFNVFLSPEDIPAKVLQRNTKNSVWAPGQHVYRQKGMGSELREIREYMPGDTFKKIAWAVSARKNKLMSRELESDISIRSVIFLDISHTMKTGTMYQTKLDFGMKISANFARLVINSGDPVGLFTFDNKIRSYLAPRSNKSHFYKMLHILSGAKNVNISMTDEVFNLYFSLFQEHLEKLSPYLPDKPREKDKYIEHYLSRYFQLSHSQEKKLREKAHFHNTLSQYLKEMDIISETFNQVFCPNCQSSSLFNAVICPKCGAAIDEQAFDKTEAITQALCRAMAVSKGKEIYILISDLENIRDLKKFLQILALVKSRKHKLVLLSPSTLSFQAGDKYDVKEHFTEEFLSKAAETEISRRLKEQRIELYTLGPNDSVNLLLSNIVQLKQREGVF